MIGPSIINILRPSILALDSTCATSASSFANLSISAFDKPSSYLESIISLDTRGSGSWKSSSNDYMDVLYLSCWEFPSQ